MIFFYKNIHDKSQVMINNFSIFTNALHLFILVLVTSNTTNTTINVIVLHAEYI
jgi:hypothetical protein